MKMNSHSRVPSCHSREGGNPYLFIRIAINIFILVAMFSMLTGCSLLKSKPAPAKPAHIHGQKPQSTQPISETKTAQTPIVEIDSDGQELAGIISTVVQSKNLVKTIRTVGKLTYNEALLSTITIRFDGWVEELFINTTGQYVKKGDPIASLYSPELLAFQEEWIHTLNWIDELNTHQNPDTKSILDQAQALAEAAKSKLSRLEISDAQLNTIATTRKPIRAVTLYSPVSGYVIDKMITKGTKIMPGEAIIKLADTSQLWIIADIYESDMKDVHLGQTATITFPAFPGKTWTAPVIWLSPSLSDATRTLPVRLELNNTHELLKPDMLATIEIHIPKGTGLTIPQTAVIDTGIQQIVYVDKGEGEFEPRKIIIGDQIGDQLIVKSGLKPGEKVVSSGTFLMDSEAQLKGIKP